VTNKYSTILASHTASLGSSQVNELLFQYSKFDNAILPDSKNATIYYPSGAHSGQNINTPQTTQQVKYQFKDDFSFSKEIAGQRHDFKVGFNIIHEPTLGGDFSTGVDAPLFSLKEDRVGSPVVDITQYGGFFQDSTPVNEYSVYIQDDWRPNNRLTVNIGLRYDYWTGFDLDQRSNPIWKVLSTQTKYNESYLKDFQNGGGGVLSNDKNNFAPRLGFSWDATGKSKTFVRGGWGIYYDFPYTNATTLFPAAAVQSNYGVAYNYNNPAGIRNPDGSFFQPGQPLPPNQLPGVAVNPPNEVASPTLKTPFSRQGSIGVSHQVTDWLGANLEFVNIAYRDIPFRFRANPTTGVGQPRRFPDFANFRIWYGGGFADYNGMNLSMTAKLSTRLTVQGFYTLSRVTGNVLSGADEFRLTDVNYQPDLRRGRDVSVNPLDPLCDACTGPLNTDARHRVTIGATYRAPYGFTIAGMLRYRSATPYLIHAGQDLNGDGFVIDLPPGVDHVNAGRGSSFSQADLRLSKEFSLAGTVTFEVMADIFNVFNAKNPAGYRGDMSSASTFGQPSTYAGDPLQGEQRLVQLGARVRF
jgi:hypothetical protein